MTTESTTRATFSPEALAVIWRVEASSARRYVSERGLFGDRCHFADFDEERKRRRIINELVAAGLVRRIDGGVFELLGRLRKPDPPKQGS